MKPTKALIVVDMQCAYFANEALDQRRSDLVAVCNKLIRSAQKHGAPVILLRTLHVRSRETWTLNMIDDNEGYLFADDGDAGYVGELMTDECIEVIKTRDSGFWQTDLLTQLRQLAIDSVVLCGVSTHTCVAQTAVDAYSANFRVELAVEGIASHNPRYHQITFDMLADEYRMKQVATSEINWRG